MRGFEWLKLDDVSDLIDYGVTASAISESIGPKFLRITDIQNGFVSWDNVPYCEVSNKERTAKALKQGDIVFARTGATTGKSFLIRSCPDFAVFASYLIRVRLSGRCDPTFVSHFFNSPAYWQQIAASASGSTQPGVNSSKLRDLLVPVPPINEQRRIATILDKADAIRRKRQQALILAKEFLRSIFLDMFGDPVTNPKGWDVVPFGEVANVKIGPFGSLLHKEDYIQDGTPIINPSHIINDQILASPDAQISDVKVDELSSYMMREGDLVIGRRGDIGRCAVVGREQNGYLCGTGSLFARFKDGMSSNFFQMQIAKTRVRDILEERAVGVTMKNLNVKIMENLPVIIPPHKAQRKFDEIRAKFLEIWMTQGDACSQSDVLFTSLSQRAFRGEL